jgi:hypothetical protein
MPTGCNSSNGPIGQLKANLRTLSTSSRFDIEHTHQRQLSRTLTTPVPRLSGCPLFLRAQHRLFDRHSNKVRKFRKEYRRDSSVVKARFVIVFRLSPYAHQSTIVWKDLRYGAKPRSIQLQRTSTSLKPQQIGFTISILVSHPSARPLAALLRK